MNLFGTDGIRAEFGNYPLTPDNLLILGKAICKWAKSKIKKPKIVIAQDTRLSSSLINSLLKAGMLQYDVEIHDSQILPTPAIYNLVQKQKLFDFGIVITASHNLYQDNGIKIIASHNKLEKKDEEEISNLFFQNQFIINYDNLGQSFYNSELKQNYIDNVVNCFQKDFLKDIRIVIDCANGATGQIAAEIFTFFGANIITIENQPNGKNINLNCGSTHPKLLKDIVIRQKADIGFAFDGDGDRIVAVNKNGDIKDGDDILAILQNHPIYNANVIVSTIMSNFGLENYLTNKNKKLIRTQVGDKYIAEVLTKENLLLGGEQSGHIILKDYLNSSDSIFVSLRILETIKLTNNWQMMTFDKYPQHTINLKVNSKQNLENEPFISIINEYKKKISGRVIVRYSGTEPLLRIMVETSSSESSKKIAIDLYNDLDLAFNNKKDSYEKEKYYL